MIAVLYVLLRGGSIYTSIHGGHHHHPWYFTVTLVYYLRCDIYDLRSCAIGARAIGCMHACVVGFTRFISMHVRSEANYITQR